VLSRYPSEKRYVMWLCRCVCGVEKPIAAHSIYYGKTTSCGCYSRSMVIKRTATHNMSRTKTYLTWSAMIQRATNKNRARAKDYVLRGITVCDRWRVFENFFTDMGVIPDGMSLERLDNNKGYSPENCTWADTKTQAANRRGKVYLTYKGVTRTQAQWARIIGVNAQTISARIHNSKYPIQKALGLPPE